VMKQLLSDSYWATPISARARTIAILATLAVMAALVFARLGMYPLWDDEANTAMFGRGIWQTGDTTAIVGDNIIAYRNGAELGKHVLKNRHIPPLQYFVAAPFSRDTSSPLLARLPFALAGLATMWLLLTWLASTAPTRRTWVLCTTALLGNVSFILYCQQARYFALTLLFAAMMTYAYAHRERGTRMLVLLAGSGVGMLASQYLGYAGVVAALGCDYLIWGRKTARLTLRQLAALAASQLVAAIVIVGTWYPVQQIPPLMERPLPLDRAQLFLKTLRDLNTNEIGVGLLMIIAPILARFARDVLTLRITLLILAATAAVTLFSPQGGAVFAVDIRYVCFLIPPCLLLSVRAIELLRLRGLWAILVGLVAFQTTFLHWLLAQELSPPTYKMEIRNTLSWYVWELTDPPPSTYDLVNDWLDAHARPGETVVVIPDFAAYALMFHNPKLVYGWQLDETRAAELGVVAPIQIRGRIAPDWIVSFGDKRQEDDLFRTDIAKTGATYERVAHFDISAVDRSRPEIVWHRFHGRWFAKNAPVSFWRRSN
jgi:hypothetical protein